jgi:hypothetical protein
LARVPPRDVQGPVFIIGPPRSGTTLVYAALVYRFRVAFLTEVHNRYCRAPIVITRLFAKRIEAGRRPVFESSYGQIQGRYAPSECGNFWYRWFPRDPHVYVPSGGLPSKCRGELQRTVRAIERATGMPILFKNSYNSLRIGALLDAFPNACFLVCRRSPVDTAQSLLLSRARRYGDKARWMGVSPREYEQIKDGTPAEQVADQVFFVEKQIAADVESFGAERFMDVHYEEFCRTPETVAARVGEFLRRRGIPVEDHGELPAAFACSSGCKIDAGDYAAIVDRVRQRYRGAMLQTENHLAESSPQRDADPAAKAGHEDSPKTT